MACSPHTSPTLHPVLGILLGWGLGLLTSPLSDWIRRAWDRPRLVRALQTELLMAQDIFAGVAVSLRERSGPLTHEYLNSLRAQLVQFDAKGPIRPGLKSLDGFLRIPDPILAANFAQRSARPGASASLRTYGLPFLISQLDRLDILPTATRAALLAVKQRLDFFNQLSEEVMRYHFMSFDPGDNWNVIDANRRELSTRAAEHAEILVKDIAALLLSPGMKV